VAHGKSEREILEFTRLFTEVQRVVDSKQLRPMVRTQYMRAAFQIPFDATVRISLDTSLTMIKESVDEAKDVVLKRWYARPWLSCLAVFHWL
jgi:SPX domain protein involved in polyphosphate accumulation